MNNKSNGIIGIIDLEVTGETGKKYSLNFPNGVIMTDIKNVITSYFKGGIGREGSIEGWGGTMGSKLVYMINMIKPYVDPDTAIRTGWGLTNLVDIVASIIDKRDYAKVIPDNVQYTSFDVTVYPAAQDVITEGVIKSIESTLKE